MSIVEGIALVLNYQNIQLFYSDMYDIVRYSVILILPGLIYLRYNKIINFVTLKYLGMMVVLASIISGCLYSGWSWIYSFYIVIMYAGIIHIEKEIKKEEQERQKASHTLVEKPKKEKRKLSPTTKALLIISIIASTISVILNYFRLINLR